MAKPSVPTLNLRDARYAVIKVSTNVLGQVRSVSPSSTANRDKKTAIAIGALEASTFYGPPDYTHKVDFEVYAATANDDAVRLLGYAPLTTGQSADLDATKTVAAVTVEVYTTTTSGTGALEGTWTFTNFVPLSMEFGADASGGDALMLSISGECDSITFTKPA